MEIQTMNRNLEIYAAQLTNVSIALEQGILPFKDIHIALDLLLLYHSINRQPHILRYEWLKLRIDPFLTKVESSQPSMSAMLLRIDHGE